MIAHMLGDRSNVPHGTLAALFSKTAGLIPPSSPTPRIWMSSARFTISVLFREVAVAQIPQQRPNQTDRAADVEHPTPPERGHDQHNDRRRDGGAKPARAVGQPLHETALLPRIPKLHGAGRARKGA